MLTKLLSSKVNTRMSVAVYVSEIERTVTFFKQEQD